MIGYGRASHLDAARPIRLALPCFPRLAAAALPYRATHLTSLTPRLRSSRAPPVPLAAHSACAHDRAAVGLAMLAARAN
jgi:hypothetical protein